MHHRVWVNFACLVEMEFYYFGLAGLELLTSSDLPASASQSAGIIGMSSALENLLNQNKKETELF